jgi:hypothetical protein
MGLWLIQESRRQWIREGASVSYADLEREALDCEPFRSLIDPDEEDLDSRETCRSGSGIPLPRDRSAGAGKTGRSGPLHL